MLVDLSDDHLGAADGLERHVDGRAQAHIAVTIRRRDRDERDIERQLRAEEERDLGEEDRDKVRAALLYGLALVGADEKVVGAEGLGMVDVAARALNVDVANFNVADAVGTYIRDWSAGMGQVQDRRTLAAADERISEMLREGRRRVHEDAAVGLYHGQRLIGPDDRGEAT